MLVLTNLAKWRQKSVIENARTYGREKELRKPDRSGADFLVFPSIHVVIDGIFSPPTQRGAPCHI